MILAESTLRAVQQTHLEHLLEPEKKANRPPPTVLLAEDNEDLRYVMECSLEFMGYRVMACANGAIALGRFQANPTIDILLTDYDMPKLTGLELARELTASGPSIPVMIITGSSLSPEMMLEIEERRWTFVSKPYHMRTLQLTIRQLIGTKHPEAAKAYSRTARPL